MHKICTKEDYNVQIPLILGDQRDQGDNSDHCGRCEEDDQGEVSGMLEVSFSTCLSHQDSKNIAYVGYFVCVFVVVFVIVIVFVFVFMVS